MVRAGGVANACLARKKRTMQKCGENNLQEIFELHRVGLGMHTPVTVAPELYREGKKRDVQRNKGRVLGSL